MFDFNLHTERNDALRFRYTKAEIRAAVETNLQAVTTLKTTTEERLRQALLAANLDAPREKLAALAETAEFADLDAQAREILAAVQLLQPLEEIQRLLALVHERMDFAPHTVLPGGTDVLLTGSDYQTLIKPFNPERIVRTLGFSRRPMLRDDTIGSLYSRQASRAPATIQQLLAAKEASDA